MLYLTTRSSRDAYTAQRALRESRGPDGGMYLPFRGPSFAPEDWKKLSAMPFGQRVAEILNRLFQMRLTCWDVDVCIGRNPVNIESLGHRTLVAELWHNPGQSYDYLARELADYARAWGLPIGNIVCCCNENSGLWELLRHGQLRTDTASVPTILPEADVAVPENLERLVYEAGGTDEVERYLASCRRGGTYAPSETVLAKMNRGLSVSVVSSSRISQTISSVYRTHRYVLSPGSALSYAGLMDYRAKAGQARNALILA